MKTEKLCRWGILGAANIARKNWDAIRHAENATLVAVASRSQEKAKEYIAECQLVAPHEQTPAACTYEELLARKDIDAVYIPLPTAIRKPWVIQAAKAGKHVLCEKPCAPTVADLEEMLAVCRQNKVQFMDGVMFMHGDRLRLMRGVLDDGDKIGPIKRITSQFSFLAQPEFMATNIRASSDLEPLGALGDLGWYDIRFTLWAMNYQLPTHVTGRILTAGKRPDASGDVPLEFSGEMWFPGGTTAAFYCSFLTQIQQWANISGTTGCLQVNDFVVPSYGCEVAFEHIISNLDRMGCDYNMPRRSQRIASPEYSNNHPTAQETGMFRTFSRIVLSGRLEPEWEQFALATQKVVNACLESARNDGRRISL
jgi:predicted dehydrogenase